MDNRDAMERLSRIGVRLDEGAYMPERAHASDAGLDLRTPDTLVLSPHSHMVVDTGVHMAIPDGYAGFLKSKSGLNVMKDITSDGTIDAGYTGSICVKLYNNGGQAHVFRRGDKISQIVIVPVETPLPVEITELPESERGADGFGSTGR